METVLFGITLYGNHYTDPTYKEWKQFLPSKIKKQTPHTDPTYKEWKLFTKTIS